MFVSSIGVTYPVVLACGFSESAWFIHDYRLYPSTFTYDSYSSALYRTFAELLLMLNVKMNGLYYSVSVGIVLTTRYDTRYEAWRN